MALLTQKLNRTKATNNIEEVLYIVLIPLTKVVKIVAFHLDIEKIKEVTASTRTRSSKSVILEGLIDTKYGNTRIYVNKKRLELRLNCKSLNLFRSVFSTGEIKSDEDHEVKDSSDKSVDT